MSAPTYVLTLARQRASVQVAHVSLPNQTDVGLCGIATSKVIDANERTWDAIIDDRHRPNLCRQCGPVMRQANGNRIRQRVCKLPSYEKLKHHVLQDGMSYNDIAKMYGMSSARSVHGTLRRRALAHGDPWPLIQSGPDSSEWERRVRIGQRKFEQDAYVDSAFLAEDVADFLAQGTFTQRQLAAKIGCSQSMLSCLIHRKHRRLSRGMAFKINLVLTRLTHPTDDDHQEQEEVA